MVVFASLSDYCRTIPLPLERNQQEIGNLPDYIIAAVFFDKIFNLFSWLSSIVILEQVFILCLPFFLGAILAKYGILAWAKSISQSHFAVFLSITVLMVMLLYKFYFPSGIIDPFISAVFVICCIILTNIVKSGGCIIYLPL